MRQLPDDMLVAHAARRRLPPELPRGHVRHLHQPEARRRAAHRRAAHLALAPVAARGRRAGAPPHDRPGRAARHRGGAGTNGWRQASSSTRRSCSCPTRTTVPCSRTRWPGRTRVRHQRRLHRARSAFTKHQERVRPQRSGVLARRHGPRHPCSSGARWERGASGLPQPTSSTTTPTAWRCSRTCHPSAHYGDFGMFEDGVGIIRSFVDDWEQAERAGIERCRGPARPPTRVHYVAGCPRATSSGPSSRPARWRTARAAVREERLLRRQRGRTGLLCGCDMARRRARRARAACGWPSSRVASLNDNAVTLDDMSLEDMESGRRAPLAVVSCNASDYLLEIIDLVDETLPTP